MNPLTIRMAYNDLTCTRQHAVCRHVDVLLSAGFEDNGLTATTANRGNMILRKLRLQRGWSQEQVAELTDLSVRTIQRIERGGQPSLESAKALAETNGTFRDSILHKTVTAHATYKFRIGFYQWFRWHIEWQFYQNQDL